MVLRRGSVEAQAQPKDGEAGRGGGKNSRGKPVRSEGAKPGLASRQAAVRLLAAVVDRKTSLDGMTDAVGGNPAYLALGEADRALARAIVLTALKHRPAIAAIIASLVERPLPDGARNLAFILEAAAAQILYLDVPDRAAVDLAVEQASLDPRSRRFAGLVNAICRRTTREKEALLAGPAASAPPLPQWFLDRMTRVYGASRAAAIGAMLAEPACLDLTVRSDAAVWAERLGGILLPTGSVRLSGADAPVPALPGYDEGAWWVQDAAAAIPARLFGDLSGRRVADLCAAPGGKTAQLALAGARVTALDRSASRLARLGQNLARLRLSADCVETDMMEFRPDEPFDAVLLDAPCSSTGTARRHPDVLWTKGAEDIARLADLQERMLRRAIKLVKPGGLVVFSNCSLDPLEGEEVVARVLADTPELAIEPVLPAELPGLAEAIDGHGAVRTTPDMLAAAPRRHGGLDGFYAARLRRRG
ncbi:MAG: RsmB/NOP family class I SAM-dependent RNA methyltransferase [Pararhizobium sp.]